MDLSKPIFITFCFLIFTSFSYSQILLKGKVIDYDTKEALAFVNIVYNEQNQGTTSNIDGSFEAFVKPGNTILKLSYVGYKSTSYSVPETIDKNLIIRLQKNDIPIEEITILAGENPAHRIINRVIENRDINNPEKMSSFKYQSYNKFYFTAEMDTTKAKIKPVTIEKKGIKKETGEIDSVTTQKTDSSYIRAKNFLSKQYLFLTESVTEKKFKFPDNNNEKVIATKVSGLSNPTFALLTTQIQSFSFYSDFIKIFDKSYVNPISPGSTVKYFFQIADTSFTEENDTVFTISYKPRKGKNFTGMRGLININSSTYAIQSVIAEPDTSSGFDIRIQQKSEYINRQQWFPVQLNTDLIFRNLLVETDRFKMYTTCTGITYFSEIELNPVFNKREFGPVELTMDQKEMKKDSAFWQKHRLTEFTSKDSATYHVIDSIGKKENLDLKMKILETISQGYIPFHFINLDYRQFLSVNQYEGLRIGFAAITNRKISSWFSIGGLAAYGTRDNQWKYGIDYNFHPLQHFENALSFSFINDVNEMGSVKFFEDKQPAFSSEYFRKIMVKDMFWNKSFTSSFRFRCFDYNRVNLFIRKRVETSPENYYFLSSDFPIIDGERNNQFNYFETGAQLKLAYKEKFIESFGQRFSVGTKYPILWLNFTAGISEFDSPFQYFKFDIKSVKTFESINLGRTTFFIQGGIIKGKIPLTQLYSGLGSYSNNRPVQSDFSFGTMRLNEFFSDKYFSFFFNQYFGNLLFKTKKFHPETGFVTNMMIGTISPENTSSTIRFKTPSKGYFESGIIINNILKNGFIGYGAGLYYRWGYYRFKKENENFALKLSVAFYF